MMDEKMSIIDKNCRLVLAPSSKQSKKNLMDNPLGSSWNKIEPATVPEIYILFFFFEKTLPYFERQSREQNSKGGKEKNKK